MSNIPLAVKRRVIDADARIERLERELTEARAVTRRIVSAYDAYRRRGVNPAPAEYQSVVDAIDAARAAASPLEMARRFHETYERLAPRYGHTTRVDTREFLPHSDNGRLMIAVCEELRHSLRGPSRDAVDLLKVARCPNTTCQDGVIRASSG